LEIQSRTRKSSSLFGLLSSAAEKKSSEHKNNCRFLLVGVQLRKQVRFLFLFLLANVTGVFVVFLDVK